MYRVTCPSCGKAYDAEKAADCHCLQPMRTVQCPHCAACLCNQGKDVFDEFWRNAPPELRARRRAAAPAVFSDENEPPETITHPMVMFADDDPTGRAIAKRVVASLGYGVALAKNGEEALAIARLYRPELIITDALMPRLDGREMGRLIKKESPDTKVVVITSVYKDPRYKYEAFRTFGIDEFLTKPINPGDLRAVVQKYLGS